jgi:hypothetical protein
VTAGSFGWNTLSVVQSLKRHGAVWPRGGAHMTSTFFPCIDCARAIVEANVVCLDTYPPAFEDPVWGASFERSQLILEEGGVHIRIIREGDP